MEVSSLKLWLNIPTDVEGRKIKAMCQFVVLTMHTLRLNYAIYILIMHRWRREAMSHN